MAETAGRLLELLSLLQRRVSWSGTDLARRLGVDVRTVRRDIDRIRSLGYVVESTPGSSGGYRLSSGAEMPPLLLDEEEAMAVAVLLGVSASMALPGIERATLATLARVDRLLPPKLQRQVKALRAATVPLARPPDPVPVGELAPLAQACDGHEHVTFDYSSRDGVRSTRRVEPYRLVATTRLWYLVGFDLDRQDWRTFRVDRVRRVRLTGHTFLPRPLDDAGRLVSAAISSTPYKLQAEVRIEALPTDVARRVGPNVAVVEPSPDGYGTLLRIGADNIAWLAGYLVGLAFPFEVLRPAEIRLQVKQLAERVARAHT
ncbi:MAG TPA: YafY family protein [Acidimicrobiales bacterium]|nr:YafY family protein [Acidimicrobiales bacterium]